jgi:hypothetical protein
MVFAVGFKKNHDVFYEVTSIALDQFRFLRDGGSYTDSG